MEIFIQTIKDLRVMQGFPELPWIPMPLVRTPLTSVHLLPQIREAENTAFILTTALGTKTSSSAVIPQTFTAIQILLKRRITCHPKRSQGIFYKKFS